MPCSQTCVHAVKPKPRTLGVIYHGKQRRTRKNQAGIHSWYWSFLHDQQKQKTMPEKMSIMKFDPKARKHVEYKEIKLK